jgi:serine protease Do
MGLSFAIPMDVVMNVVRQIKSTGTVSRGWLGVQIQDVTRELAESFNMDRPYGALIAKVIPKSPSEKAGFKIGDIIIEFDGHIINTSGELPPVVGMTKIGEKVKVKIIREGKEKTIKTVIGLLSEKSQRTSSKQVKKELNRLGLVVSELTKDQRKLLDVDKNGVLVQDVRQGPALDAGIHKGDVILRINNNIIRDESGFDKIVKKLTAGQSFAVLIQRQGSPIFLALKLK